MRNETNNYYAIRSKTIEGIKIDMQSKIESYIAVIIIIWVRGC